MLARLLFMGLLGACFCWLASCSSSSVPLSTPSSVSAVTITCSSPSVLLGQTSRCSALVTGAGSYSSAVTWSIAPANAGTIDSTGVLTPSVAGTATITATSVQTPNQSGSVQVVVANPVPTISSPPSPAALPVGASAPSLTLSGTNFLSTSVVTLNGQNKPSTYISSTQLQLALAAADLATTGNAAIAVTNPTPGGGTSNSVNLLIGIAPALTLNGPTTLTVGQATALSVTATGTPAPALSLQGALPTGVAFQPATGQFSGTPQPGSSGNYPLTLLASNGVGTPASLSLTLQVSSAPPDALAITTSLPSGDYGIGTSIPITVLFSDDVTSLGNLTLTLNTTPSRSCTLTISNSTSGSCSYTVRGGDEATALAATLSGTVKNQNGVASSTFAPAANLTASASINIVTYTTASTDSMMQWKLDDAAATSTVTGNSINGALQSGNTIDVASTLDTYPAFHLNGKGQYVSIPIGLPLMRPDELSHLWTNAASNPLLGGTQYLSVAFGHLAPNPSGGWYYFAPVIGSVWRWQSSDLQHWSNPVIVLSKGNASAWDSQIDVATVFRKPSDGTWIMLYRGQDSTGKLQIGLATSPNGTAFTRKSNGGVNDGLFPQFGNNYDPTAVLLVGGTYYVYANGSPTHATTNLYTSTDDFQTFTPYPLNPIFRNAFCPTVWWQDGDYFMLINRDLLTSGSALYDHGVALYRSTTPLFDASNRDYLGYAVINQDVYDNAYLDTPDVPFLDVYRTSYPTQFGNTLYATFTGMLAQGSKNYDLSLTSVDRTTLASLPAIPESTTELLSTSTSFSFWIQFDSLTSGEPIFSIGNDPASPTPAWLATIQANGSGMALSLMLSQGTETLPYAFNTNTPYHVVVVGASNTKTLYINGQLITSFNDALANTQAQYLYLGSGYGGETLAGSLFDFRIYPKSLSAAEVAQLYKTGNITP